MEPSKIPCLVEGISESSWIDFYDQFFAGRGNLPAFTCKNIWDSYWNPQGLCDLTCPSASAACTGRWVDDTRWFKPPFSVGVGFDLGRWTACVTKQKTLPRSGLRSGSMRMTSVRPLEIRRFKKCGPSTMRG